MVSRLCDLRVDTAMAIAIAPPAVSCGWMHATGSKRVNGGTTRSYIFQAFGRSLTQFTEVAVSRRLCQPRCAWQDEPSVGCQVVARWNTECSRWRRRRRHRQGQGQEVDGEWIDPVSRRCGQWREQRHEQRHCHEWYCQVIEFLFFLFFFSCGCQTRASGSGTVIGQKH